MTVSCITRHILGIKFYSCCHSAELKVPYTYSWLYLISIKPFRWTPVKLSLFKDQLHFKSRMPLLLANKAEMRRCNIIDCLCNLWLKTELNTKAEFHTWTPSYCNQRQSNSHITPINDFLHFLLANGTF